MAFRRFSSWRFLIAESSTGRLTQSNPDGTVSNSLLLRCLASCFSNDGKEECARETQEGCPAPVKSSVFRTISSENLHSGQIFRPLCPFRFRRKGTRPRCRYSAKNCRPSWNFLHTGIVIMPYGVHECLRSHQGMNLTGKLRDWALTLIQGNGFFEYCQCSLLGAY